MEINLSQDSFVDRRTGEVTAPSEFLENLREIEGHIQQADEKIEDLKHDLKSARSARELLVVKLRGAVREGKVLPLLEAAEQPDPEPADPDGLDIDDTEDD